MTMIQENTFTCPVDGEVFQDGVVVSTNQMGQHTDFKPVVGGVFPFSFYIHSCPKCGFSGYEEDFDREYSDEFKKWVISELAEELDRDSLYGGQKYFLAGRCAEKLDRSHKEVADLYLRGAWCALEEESPELESRCREKAVKHFEQALDSGEYDKEDRAPAVYLIGELYRRLGNRDKAIEWFDKVSNEIINQEEQAWVLEITRQQKTDPLELFPDDLNQ